MFARLIISAGACFAALLLVACGGEDAEVISADPPTAAPATSPERGGTNRPTATPKPLGFKTGANNYTITVDGARREFIVYVPTSYNQATPTPLVIMFHGSN